MPRVRAADGLNRVTAILRELFGDAVKADKKSRLRSLKDLDAAAATLASACQMLLDDTVPDTELRKQLFARISPEALALALAGVNKLIRPTDNVYYQELDPKYKTVRRFLPALAEHIQLGANAAGEPSGPKRVSQVVSAGFVGACFDATNGGHRRPARGTFDLANPWRA